MTRTPTKPPTDKAMWRKLIARAHPDAAGEHELFIWAQKVREHVCNEGLDQATPPPPRSEPPPRPEARIVHEDGRVPFPQPADFEELTARALEVAAEVDGILAAPLRHLADCRPMTHLAHEQECGASYKRLAYIAHLCGMDKAKRVEWYPVCESILLSDRHAGHIIKRLKEQS